MHVARRHLQAAVSFQVPDLAFEGGDPVSLDSLWTVVQITFSEIQPHFKNTIRCAPCRPVRIRDREGSLPTAAPILPPRLRQEKGMGLEYDACLALLPIPCRCIRQ